MIYAILISVLIIAFLNWIRTQEVKKSLPRAPGYWVPFIGNLIQWNFQSNEHTLLREQRNLESDAITFSHFLPRRHHFIITSLDLAKECFIQNSDKASDRVPPSPSSELYREEGIIHASGAKWRAHRRTVVTSLRNLGMGKNKLEGMVIEESQHLIEALKIFYMKSNESPNEIITTATTNIICQMAFGIRFNYMDKSFQEFFAAFKQIFKSLMMLNFRNFLPKFIRHLPGIYNDTFEKYVKSHDTIKKFCSFQIERYKTFMKSGSYVPAEMEECVLERLLIKQMEDPEMFSDGAIESILRNLFAAGTDTSSTALTWSVVYLKNNPNIQKLLKEEIGEVIGDEVITLKHLDAMPKIHAFILETLRFGAVAPFSLVHLLNKDINTKKYSFPAGSLMQVSIFCVQRDKKAFKNPDFFDINNFLDRNNVVVNDHLIPFSLGPRICPGDKLAKMEIFFFLVEILRNFNIECLDSKNNEDANASMGVTRIPKQFQVKLLPV